MVFRSQKLSFQIINEYDIVHNFHKKNDSSGTLHKNTKQMLDQAYRPPVVAPGTGALVKAHVQQRRQCHILYSLENKAMFHLTPCFNWPLSPLYK